MLRSPCTPPRPYHHGNLRQAVIDTALQLAEESGDERISLRELSSLAQHEQFSEGRALAALYLVRDLLTQRGEFRP